MSFVHLHVHSEYSLLDGASRIHELVQLAAATGMPALALTDHGVLYGAIEFYVAARAAGIKPIIGCEVYVAGRSREQKEAHVDRDPHHLILLARDTDGYRNLLQLVTSSHLEGFYYRPRVDKELLRRHASGLIALSACLGGEVCSRIREGDELGALAAAVELREIFGPENFYLELQDHGMPLQRQANEALMRISGQTGIPLVATNDSHYTARDDAEAHDVLLCLQTGTVVAEPKRMRFEGQEFYLKTPEEMGALFEFAPSALTNTLAIAERCALELELDQPRLPRYEVPPGETPESHLRHLAETGLQARYPEVTPAVRERLEREYQVIVEMGYASYFLIVSDFVSYARRAGVSVGPGRGSAAGSIVSYALGITTLDPLRHGLIFERFLNPERVSPPDIDIDFDDRNRDRVIDYVAEKYGHGHVAQIITFGTMKARAVIRDVGRVLGVPLPDVDRLAKLVPFAIGITLERAMQMVPELRDAEQQPAYEKLIRNARKLEGLARHASTHAAGIVIAPAPLTEFVPLQQGITRTAGGEKRSVMTQYDMTAVQRIGLLKMDFLGLRNLSIIQDCLANLEQVRGLRLDLEALPLDDPRTYALLAAADTQGVFQMESPGLRRLLQDMKPSSFDDITAAIALFRPGPIEGGMIDQYVKCKHGEREIVYPLPELEPILRETYGVIVYQEQVMQIASVVAGFSMGEADILRGAMGKKKKDEMARMRKQFIRGAIQRQVPEAKANEIFDLMAYFAGYGFPKAHSAAYAVLSYQTAYLKANYPLEYMAALLTNEAGNHPKVAEAIIDCHARNLQVFPPDINRSGGGFTVGEGAILYGLRAIKNVGARLVDELLAERARGGPYRSLLDLCLRVDPRELNRRALESLIRSGALGSLGERACLLASLDRVTDRATQILAERASGQTSLFGLLPTGDEDAGNPQAFLVAGVPEAPQDERLQWEKDLLGLYLSDHPLRRLERELHARVDTYVNQLDASLEDSEVRLGGFVRGSRVIFDKRNRQMAFVQLEDLTGTVELVLFSSVYEVYRELLAPDAVVVVRGKVDARGRGSGDPEEGEREEDVKVLVDEVYRFDDPAHDTWSPTQVAHVRVPRGTSPEQLAALERLLREHPGPDRVLMHLERETEVVQMELGEEFRVAAGGASLAQGVRELLGAAAWEVEVVRRRGERSPAGRRRAPAIV